MAINEPERYWERALKETAHVIVTRAACLRRGRDALVICGLHDKVLAQYIMLEAQRIGSQPFLWEFNEAFFKESFERYHEKALGTGHIAIGNNIHLGGANKASLHVDFVLDKPTVEADSKVILRRGRFVEKRRHAHPKTSS